MREKKRSYYLLIRLRMARHKQKPILPSLREKKRYLAFEIISKSPITDFSPIYDAIHVSVLELMGEMEASKANMTILKEKWNPEEQKGIIRVNNKYVDHLRASLALIDDINDEDVIVSSLGVSGILKKAVNKYMAS